MMNKRRSYTKPITDLTQMENMPFMTNISAGTHKNAGDGGLLEGEEARISFSWSFQDREGITSDALNNSWDN